MDKPLTVRTPEAQLAIWNSEAQRLSNSNGFSDLSSSLFGVWGLMEQEIALLKQTDENSSEFLENNLKYLLSESRWNQQTAFRNYLGVFFNKLQQHARTPMQFPMKDKETLGFDDEEYALFSAMQRHIPNNIQSMILDKMARLMLSLYWANAAQASYYWVPGFLMTLLSDPVLFFYQNDDLQVAVKKFVELQKQAAQVLNEEVSESLGWKVEGHSLIFERIIDKLASVYLNLSSINEKNALAKCNNAKDDLQWILNFWSNRKGTHRCVVSGKFYKTDSMYAVKQLVNSAALSGAWPLHYSLMPNLTLVPLDKEAFIISLPPLASFWHSKQQHPYLDLVDSSIPANLLVRDIDFSQTIFHRQCKRLLGIIDHLQPTSPQYKMLKISGQIISAFQRINDKSNNACGTGICTFFGATLASKFEEDHQTVQIAVTALAAAGGQILPSTLQNISSVLSDRHNKLKNKEMTQNIPSSEIGDIIKALLENES